MIEMRNTNTFLYDGFIDFLNHIKKHHQVKRILEIGSYRGESFNLMKNYLGDDTLIICIDPWDIMTDDNDITSNSNFSEVEEKFNLNTLTNKQYGKLKFYSDDIHTMFADNYFDMIYIDGLHTYNQVLTDIINYKSKVKKNGLICGHDITIPITDRQRNELYKLDSTIKLRKQVTNAVLKGLQINENELLKFNDSSWLYVNK